ncbi:DDB1- and CUL4-associated factor 1-like [Etheostoma cragini]|uniref:DDB1- and CUL4-associated factor 1-like n=1 Tax=Etheostoma cragini TaxID=417921 RepID=UPI00155EF658|nr:DDB1- and CUL4-associated factor 1-like [Etheostoma cragini]
MSSPGDAAAAVTLSALAAAVSAAMATANAVDAKADLTALLDQWEETQQGTSEQLVSVLTRISELIERETGEYHKADPDPFDDRHPGRADPDCMLGQLLKMLFMNDDFTNAPPQLLAIFMQLDTRSLLMNYIDLRKTKNVQLTFDALLYLSSMLLHKKFAAEFITHGGVQKLLEIPRPSMAATGVSLCLYYLAYNQDAMERVCTLPNGVLSDMVSYALWLLESSHASGVCHATMFFSISFSFRAVLQLFDHQDGLRRLVNLVSTLQILNTENEVSVMSDDQVFANRQTAKHTCMALRRYFEAHLAVKVEQVKQSLHTSDGGTSVPQQPFFKAYTYTREQVIEMMEFLIECGPPQIYWEPVEVFHKMSCVPLMLQLISTACDWRTYYGSEYFCKPLYKMGGCHGASHTPVSVCLPQVLLSLLSVKMPITDADLIRALACKALVGLSRSSAIRQIISKLPLFTSSHIQQLMKEPLLQDKRSEHVRFCRYAADLTERVSGKPLLMGTDVSLARLQRANVVAQSRITFPEKELLMLIRNHLVAKGLHDTANTLVKEANLSVTSLCPNSSSCVTPPPPSSAVMIPRTCRSAGGMAARVGGHVGSSPASSAAAASSSTPSSSRSLAGPHPSCSSSSTPLLPPAPSTPSTPSLPPPHPAAHGSHLVGRILFTRERPAAPCTSGKKLKALKQKSDHGAFIQVSVHSFSWCMNWCFAFCPRNSFVDDHYVEFSKHTQDRVIGTKDQIAHIYDIQTGQKILTLNDTALANNYKRNCATFNPTDDLVLNDGVLWDVRASQAIHKFDKFNMNISGVFHPNGLEVIINTEIWDLRTFHLLHTVPALDQCRLVFNSNATIMYGAMLQADEEDDAMDQQMKSPFGSSFRTFDATEYKPIATVDVKRNIFDLCTDTKDCYLAVIENQDTVSLDTVCRLYEVGRQKLAEEGDDDDDQDDEDQDEDDSSDTDDDDDDDDDMETDPLLEELANNDDPENDDSAPSPTEEEVADLLGSDTSDDNSDDDDDDDDSADSEHSNRSDDGWDSMYYPEQSDDETEMFRALSARWFS